MIDKTPFLECECNDAGSANGNICDQKTGACPCKGPGWYGSKCKGKLKTNNSDSNSKNRINHRNLAENNSVIFKTLAFLFGNIVCIFVECECDEDGSANGNICNQITGDCICKDGYHGYRCNHGKP